MYNILAGPNATIRYEELSEKIEKFCEWFCIALFGTGAFCSVSVLIFSCVNYYIFGLGEESFYLFFPTVYVLID